MARRNSTSRRVQRSAAAPPTCSVTGARLSNSSSVNGSRTLEHQFARERSEVPFDVGRAHLRERRRSPAGGVVLVDDHRTHTLVEIMAFDDARAAADLRERDLEAEG